MATGPSYAIEMIFFITTTASLPQIARITHQIRKITACSRMLAFTSETLVKPSPQKN